VYVIVQRRGEMTLWLVSVFPLRWGDRDRAMVFRTRGEARRAATTIRSPGPWAIEPA
jgi:hypothetical protein